MRKTLAVLGAGNMGLAITDGIIRSGILSAQSIILVRRNIEKLISYEKAGCRITSDLYEAAKRADVLLLSVKPQMMKDLLSVISPVCRGKLVISIAAGIKIETIENALEGSYVVRAMPNTPLTVGEGVTEICCSQTVTDEDLSFAKSLFEGSGTAFLCREEEINAFTALTSSAVAYVAAVEEAMCRWAENCELSGYDRETVCSLVSKTVIGASKLMLEKNISPRALIKSVASPNGTTERALKVFENEDLEGLFERAMTACCERARELSDMK